MKKCILMFALMFASTLCFSAANDAGMVSVQFDLLNKDGNIIVSGKMDTPYGKAAPFSVTANHPYILSTQKSFHGTPELVTAVVNTGWLVELTPTLTSDEKIDLKFSVHLSELDPDKSPDMPSANESRYQLQAPIVSVYAIDSMVRLDSAQPVFVPLVPDVNNLSAKAKYSLKLTVIKI
jgi:hypothetical protein